MPDPDATENESPDADVKARFREALDKKNASTHASSAAGESNAGGVHGSETQGPVRRTFRRKSGG
jgi:hypothetical protein